MKENLQGSERHLILANEKAEEVNVKKLNKGNPTMIRKFQELKGTSNDPNEQAYENSTLFCTFSHQNYK